MMVDHESAIVGFEPTTFSYQATSKFLDAKTIMECESTDVPVSLPVTLSADYSHSQVNKGNQKAEHELNYF